MRSVLRHKSIREGRNFFILCSLYTKVTHKAMHTFSVAVFFFVLRFSFLSAFLAHENETSSQIHLFRPQLSNANYFTSQTVISAGES